MKRPNGYWNIKENVIEEAKKYSAKMDFKKGKSAAYKSACKNGWLVEMFWFKKQTAPNKKWYRENVFEESKKYKSRSEFERNSSGAYDVALKNGWLDELFPIKGIDKGKWTKENVFEEARKYQTKYQFKKGASGAYQKARENGWINEMDWFENGFILMWKKRKSVA